MMTKKQIAQELRTEVQARARMLGSLQQSNERIHGLAWQVGSTLGELADESNDRIDEAFITDYNTGQMLEALVPFELTGKDADDGLG